MAWIESHDTLEHHPKTLHLMELTGWSKNETIGLLHRLWWWATRYAEDGDLSKYPPERVATAIEAQLDDKNQFFNVLIECGWLTKQKRINDWWEYIKRYFYAKYHTANPDKLLKLEKKATSKRGNTKGKARGNTKGLTTLETQIPLVSLHTYLPNLHTVHTYQEAFDRFWKSYPSRKGKKLEKAETLNRFLNIKSEDMGKLLLATKNYSESEMVGNGIGIKDPKRFIWNGKGNEPWRDWIEPEKPGGGNGRSQGNHQQNRKAPGGARGDFSKYDTPTKE